MNVIKKKNKKGGEMIKFIQGDCLEKIKLIPDNSIDAVITDPPYFLINESGKGFMNKE